MKCVDRQKEYKYALSTFHLEHKCQMCSVFYKYQHINSNCTVWIEIRIVLFWLRIVLPKMADRNTHTRYAFSFSKFMTSFRMDRSSWQYLPTQNTFLQVKQAVLWREVFKFACVGFFSSLVFRDFIFKRWPTYSRVFSMKSDLYFLSIFITVDIHFHSPPNPANRM